MMNADKFWPIIEATWSNVPSLDIIRAITVKTNDQELLPELSNAMEVQILPHFKEALAKLDKKTLTNFILFQEKKLYQIDRQEVHQYTDGSDDGFLYSRCFILGMGKAYYNMIDKNPKKATMDLEAEGFGFAAYQVYEEKFGQEFDRNSVHCIESCSNEEKW